MFEVCIIFYSFNELFCNLFLDEIDMHGTLVTLPNSYFVFSFILTPSVTSIIEVSYTITGPIRFY